VEGGDRLLVLAAHSQPLVGGGVGARREGAHALAPGRQLGVQLGARGAGAQQFAAVVANVGDRPDRDDLAGGGGAAAADATEQPVALGDLDQQRASRLRHVRVVGVAHDRRERAIDVEQHRGA
jgi:hypothetical protein